MIQSVLSWSSNENDGVIKDMRNTGVLTYLKSTLVNLFFNTLNQFVLWISSDGAEQQAARGTRMSVCHTVLEAGGLRPACQCGGVR